MGICFLRSFLMFSEYMAGKSNHQKVAKNSYLGTFLRKHINFSKKMNNGPLLKYIHLIEIRWRNGSRKRRNTKFRHTSWHIWDVHSRFQGRSHVPDAGNFFYVALKKFNKIPKNLRRFATTTLKVWGACWNIDASQAVMKNHINSWKMRKIVVCRIVIWSWNWDFPHPSSEQGPAIVLF